jgi:hypothetical protein
MEIPQQRGWWSRNWKWFVPVVIVLPILICGGCIGTIFFGVRSALRSSDAYKHVLTVAQASPEVQRILGTPITASGLPSGGINVKNDGSGDTEFSVTLRGPRGEGRLEVHATRANGVWSYDRLRFTDSGNHEFSLLTGPTNRTQSDDTPVKTGDEESNRTSGAHTP